MSTLLGLVVITPRVLGGMAPSSGGAAQDPVTNTRTLSFRAVADTYVTARHPKTNYGTATELSVDGDPIKETYLKFELAGLEGTITSAVIRMHVAEPSPLSGGSLRQMQDVTWSETNVTFETKPDVDGHVLSSAESVEEGMVVEFDATQAQLDTGIVSFALTSTRPDGVEYASRETDAGAELVITLSEGLLSTPQPVTVESPEPSGEPATNESTP